MEIPRNKPKEIVWDREWVAMHMEFAIPDVTDADFLAEFKTMMIEVAGERLYDYRAVEALVGYIETRNFTCEFSAGSSGRTAVYRWLTETFKQQMRILLKATDTWRNSAPAREDDNSNDPVLIQRLRAWDGVVVEVGAELTAEQEASIRLAISGRRAAREARKKLMMNKYLPDDELTTEELVTRQAEQERIENLRFEGLVAKERERYRKPQQRKKN